MRSHCHFLQAKQWLVEGAEEQGVHLKQLLLNTDLRKVSNIAVTEKDSAYAVDIKLKKERKNSHTTFKADYQLFLQFGQPQLPDGINRADSLSLKGAHVFQITSSEDVSKPSKGVGTSSHR